LELYNEEWIDLIKEAQISSNQNKSRPPSSPSIFSKDSSTVSSAITIREDKGKLILVGATEIVVTSAQEALKYYFHLFIFDVH
jgi:hypothetical protein